MSRLPDGFDMLTDDPVFRQVAAGGHPALRVVERARNPDTGKVARDITVGDIRSLSEFFRMTTVTWGGVSQSSIQRKP